MGCHDAIQRILDDQGVTTALPLDASTTVALMVTKPFTMIRT